MKPVTKLCIFIAMVLVALMGLLAHGASVGPTTSVIKLRSPKDAPSASLAMSKTSTVLSATQSIVTPAPTVNLMADFAPLLVTNNYLSNSVIGGPAQWITNGWTNRFDNMTAFIEARENITNAWTRFSLPYAATGGTFAVPWTNKTGRIYYRAGYQFPK